MNFSFLQPTHLAEHLFQASLHPTPETLPQCSFCEHDLTYCDYTDAGAPIQLVSKVGRSPSEASGFEVNGPVLVIETLGYKHYEDTLFQHLFCVGCGAQFQLPEDIDLDWT